jgi:hypothetical protein
MSHLKLELILTEFDRYLEIVHLQDVDIRSDNRIHSFGSRLVKLGPSKGPFCFKLGAPTGYQVECWS